MAVHIELPFVLELRIKCFVDLIGDLKHILFFNLYHLSVIGHKTVNFVLNIGDLGEDRTAQTLGDGWDDPYTVQLVQGSLQLPGPSTVLSSSFTQCTLKKLWTPSLLVLRTWSLRIQATGSGAGLPPIHQRW